MMSACKESLFVLPSLSTNTEEGTWLGRELPDSWFPKVVGVIFPWDLQASAVVNPGTWEGAPLSRVCQEARGDGGWGKVSALPSLPAP